MSEEFRQFRADVEQIEIPKAELKDVVNLAVEKAGQERRGKRKFTYKRTAVAVAVVVLASSLVLFMNTQKNTSEQSTSMADVASNSQMEQKSSASESDVLSNNASKQEIAQQDAATAEELPAVTDNRKLIQTVTVQLETTKLDSAVKELEASATQFGGYIENSSVMGTSMQDAASMRSASYTIRIPASKLAAYLQEAAGIGNLVSKQVITEDVTEQYVDTEARMKALKLQEERLLELLKQSGTLTDIVEIEKQLATVRYEIEAMTAQLKNYDLRVAYSTVQVELTEVKALTQQGDTLGERIQNTFSDSIGMISSGVQSFIVFVIGNSPIILFLAGVGGAAFWAIRKRNK